MTILLSPSKTINFKPVQANIFSTKPQFLKESKELAKAVINLGTNLKDIFGVSNIIAEENQRQFKSWSSTPNNDKACPAAWAYRGETFAGLSIENLNKKYINFLQTHLCIISGLYGLLRPLDEIMPYRLEMSTKLKGKWGNTLYDFWGDKLAKYVEKQKPDFILNCSSKEYFDVVGKHLPSSMSIITPKFIHNGIQKMAFSKYSRGLMARWIAEKEIKNSDDIKKFNAEGYIYDSKHSTRNEPVFNAPKDFSIAGRWKKT